MFVGVMMFYMIMLVNYVKSDNFRSRFVFYVNRLFNTRSSTWVSQELYYTFVRFVQGEAGKEIIFLCNLYQLFYNGCYLSIVILPGSAFLSLVICFILLIHIVIKVQYVIFHDHA